jgi:hypothetical protein
MRLAATAFFLAALPSLVSAQRPALSATEIRDISYARVEGLYRGKSNRLGVCRIRFRAPKTLPILRHNVACHLSARLLATGMTGARALEATWKRVAFGVLKAPPFYCPLSLVTNSSHRSRSRRTSSKEAPPTS